MSASKKILKIKSPAKINLALDILGKEGGYHLINTILQEIGLCDELTFRRIPENRIIIKCNNHKVPKGYKNTVHKAVKIIKKFAPGIEKSRLPGLVISIKKNIPLSAGLGGGSSNAACTLKALNGLWKLGFSKTKLREIAGRIGMDAPFFIEGGTATGSRYGDKITVLPQLKMPPHMIIINDKKSSTQEMYAAADHIKTCANLNMTAQLIKILKNPGKSKNVKFSKNYRLLHNDFDQLISAKTKSVQKKLLQLGAEVVHISGSGPALYALFISENTLSKAFRELKGQVGFIWKSIN